MDTKSLCLYVKGLREMVEILESSKNTLEMEVTSVKELKEKVNKWDMITSYEVMWCRQL